MTVGKKLTIGMGAMLAITTVSAVSSLHSLNSVGGELAKSTGVFATKLALSGDLKATANIMRTGQRGLLLATLQRNPQAIEKTVRDYTQNVEHARTLVAQLRPLQTQARGLELTDTLEANIDLHQSCFRRVQELCAAGKVDEAGAFYREKGLIAGAAMEKAAVELMERQIQYMSESAKAGDATLRNARWTEVIVNLLSFLVAGGLLFVIRKVTRILRRNASELSADAEQIGRATAQVSAASESLARAASEQAASLEQTSASAEQITSMTQRNAESSQRAAGLMAQVDTHTSEGNRALDHMVRSMGEITESSDKISQIIKVIDEIAFQTNILALNAAVEAARAGEAGMGFAVVADEVRTLAQRSAQAARDTSVLIENSIGKSKQGRARVQDVADAIRSITGGAAEVKALVDEVSRGSQEQAKAIHEIATAVSRMQQVTQSTAASAEEGASASQQMAAQAESLNEIVNELSQMVGSG